LRLRHKFTRPHPSHPIAAATTAAIAAGALLVGLIGAPAQAAETPEPDPTSAPAPTASPTDAPADDADRTTESPADAAVPDDSADAASGEQRAAATTAPVVLLDDDFSRDATAGWGQSDNGLTYSSWSSRTAVVSVDGEAAAIALAPGESAYLTPRAVSADDIRISADIRLTESGGRSYYAFTTRVQNDGSSYRVRVSTDASGRPQLSVVRSKGRIDTELKSVLLPMSLLGDSWVTFDASVTGTDAVVFEARLTPKGEKPGAPQLTATDRSSERLSSAGGFAVWGYSSSSAGGQTVLQLDSLTALVATTPLSGEVPTEPEQPPTEPEQPPTEPEQPPTEPEQPPTEPNTSTRGATTVGTASYPVPQGAVFVNGASTSGTQNGRAETPFRTVQAAVTASPAGSTIVIRGGEYHESVNVPFSKTLTIQAYPGEAVWFDGSTRVTSWSQSGSTWVSGGWKAEFSSDMLDGNASWFVDPKYPMANRPDMLFIDGVAQKQVASASQVVAGTFAVDYASDRLILGTNPAGHQVRVSDLPQALNVQSANSVLRGFGVRRYATSYDVLGTVRMHNVGTVLRDLVIEDNATIGLFVGNDRATVDNLTVRRNGLLGFSLTTAYNSTVTDSLFTDNNVERFNGSPVAGGIKVTRSRGVLMSNVDTSRNIGSGTWFDESCFDVKIVDVTSNGNTEIGIHAELSSQVTIARSQTFDNKEGIRIFDTENVLITNNDLGNNSRHDINLMQDERRQATHRVGRDPRVSGADPTVTWITRNISINNNVFAAGGPRAIFAHDTATGRAVDTWNLTIEGNLFSSSTGGPSMVTWGGSGDSYETFQTPQALAAAKNRTWVNAMTTRPEPFASMTDEIEANASVAVPLSSRVATLLGLAAGAEFLGSGR